MKATRSCRLRRFALRLCAVVVCLAMTSCATPGVLRIGGVSSIRPSSRKTITINDEGVPLAGGTKVLEPKSPGDVSFSGGGATIDASNTDQGYIMIKYSGGNGKVKVQITRSGKSTYTYNLNTGGKYEVFPLTSGDGNYKIGVYTNVSGNQYAEAISKTVDVKLKNSMLPFLYPSQYVNFSAKSKTVAKSTELAKGKDNDLAVVESIYNFVVGNISYDTKLAQTVKSGYLPVVDSVLAAKKGICFDYAAVMSAMLRAQQIPTRLEVGYVSNGAYHAWISVYLKETGWVNGIIQFDGKNWKLMDPTFASSGGGSSSIMQYIGDGKNYKTQYIY